MAILKDLIVHGSSRFLNKIYAEELETSAFEAESAIIKKLKADDATVVGLLDVQGEMHTNSWTNSNIATIDGSFYITPTIGSDSGTVDTTTTSLTFHGANYAVNSLYLNASNSNVAWTTGSKVLVTGEVQVDGEYIPFGTLMGQLGSKVAADQISITGITTNKKESSNSSTYLASNILSEIGTKTGLPYRKLKISLYQRANGSTFYPIGIYMTALGPNSKTFIDIYGGVNATTTAGSSGGFADPNLRIGNLSGLGAVEGTTPQGWGIYTTNGYFKGVIVSSAGKIGNFTINSALYSNNHSAWNSNVSGIYINNDGISGGAGGKWWLWNDGSAKIGAMTLSAAGVLTVPAANVSGELTAATINGSKISAGDIAAARIQTNLISAINAKVSDISALTATLGGFQVDSTAIHTKNVAITSNADNSIALSSADFTRTINNTSRAGLRFAIGDKLGITGDGAIYASSATISGNITATSLTLGSGVTIGYSSISNPPTIPTTVAELTDSGSYLTTSVASSTYATQTAANNAAKTATTYITDIDSNKGITIKPADASGNDYLQMNSSAINFYRNNVETLKIEDSAIRVGKLGSNLRNVYITNDVVQIRNNTSVLAEYGSSIKLYKPGTTTAAVEISSTGATFTGGIVATSFSAYDSNNKERATVNTNGLIAKDASGNTVAKFGETVQIGQDEQSHLNLDYHSLKTIDKEGWSYFEVNDMRDKNGYARTSQDFIGDGNRTTFTVSFDPYYKAGQYVYDVYVNNELQTYETDYTVSGRVLTMAIAPSENAIVRIYYYTGSRLMKAYTIGTRTQGSGKIPGAYSVAEGSAVMANGNYSHAEGYGTSADNTASHAEGWMSGAYGYASHAQNESTIASSRAQSVIGKYNAEDTDDEYALIIGNGSGELNRSNALTVDWHGNVQMYLDTINVELDNSILTAIQSLGWEDDVID